jgi:hypothetical protein
MIFADVWLRVADLRDVGKVAGSPLKLRRSGVEVRPLGAILTWRDTRRLRVVRRAGDAEDDAAS